MKTIKVSEATNVQLDWLVAKCEGVSVWIDTELPNYPCVMETPSNDVWVTPRRLTVEEGGVQYRPATDWSQMGPMIDRERIIFSFYDSHPVDADDVVHARLSRARMRPDAPASWYAPQRGATILIAAARCYVTSKLGDTVEVPEELT